ncbi:MAG: BLUF domain-containing protein [Pikeienuella sp.]
MDFRRLQVLILSYGLGASSATALAIWTDTLLGPLLLFWIGSAVLAILITLAVRDRPDARSFDDAREREAGDAGLQAWPGPVDAGARSPPVSPVDPGLVRLVYVSQPAPGLGRADLAAIATHAQRWNGENALTGVLFYDETIFLQLLEGPEEAVKDCIAKIEADPRHGAIHRIISLEPALVRLFPTRTMRFVPLRSLIWQRTRFDQLSLRNLSQEAAAALPDRLVVLAERAEDKTIRTELSHRHING